MTTPNNPGPRRSQANQLARAILDTPLDLQGKVFTSWYGAPEGDIRNLADFLTYLAEREASYYSVRSRFEHIPAIHSDIRLSPGVLLLPAEYEAKKQYQQLEIMEALDAHKNTRISALLEALSALSEGNAPNSLIKNSLQRGEMYLSALMGVMRADMEIVNNGDEVENYKSYRDMLLSDFATLQKMQPNSGLENYINLHRHECDKRRIVPNADQEFDDTLLSETLRGSLAQRIHQLTGLLGKLRELNAALGFEAPERSIL